MYQMAQYPGLYKSLLSLTSSSYVFPPFSFTALCVQFIHTFPHFLKNKVDGQNVQGVIAGHYAEEAVVIGLV